MQLIILLTLFPHPADKKMKKSQMALEFVLLFSVSIFVMMILLFSFYEINKYKVDEKIDTKMGDFHYTVQSEFILASQMNNGYVRSFVLPETVENTYYNISISGKNIVLHYDGINYYKKVPDTVGDFVDGQNILKKNNDIIYLNQ
jgi:hypothetical protein